MYKVVRFVNSRFHSNTYIITHSKYDNIWVVDPGDTENVFEWMKLHSKTSITGILLTHAHFDHIYGINDILFHYPNCIIYISNDYGKECLSNSKMNGSKYTKEGPIVIPKGTNIHICDEIITLWNDVKISTLYTPGHSDDSQCLLLNNILFSGDTIIHNYRTVTKLKSGSEEKLKETINSISTLKGNNIKIYGGHEEPFELDSYDLNKTMVKYKF